MSGHSEEYEVERKMLQDGDDELMRVYIEKVITNEYERLQEEKHEIVMKAVAVTV